MIGDLILWIKKVFKQQTCMHDYRHVNASWRANCSDFEECVKCDKIK